MAPEAPAAGLVSLAGDALLLDVDGTILDIAPSPEDVDVPQSLKRTLAALQQKTGGATALVSGRVIAVLDRLFAPLRVAIIGCHGAERRAGCEQSVESRAEPLSPELRGALLSAVADIPQLRIEDKGYTMAFHYRRSPDVGSLLERRLGDCAGKLSPELRLLHGKLVVEVKSRRFDKGSAIRSLMCEPPFRGRRPVYLGDDTTDEDAFAVMREFGGLGISVGRPMANAGWMLPDPSSARYWLACVAQ